ncbi:KH domain-containing protein [candidate division KSB3 bacterium]|uniref:RNA-binding protein KhpB n=1 Tax=candidate division KSB3 bacterium TaxID=2044937 RepID=A0A9D5JS04_9BACT|nr:KH domain-containing protein [candidate division KSB3 bacterium]MBD3323050.1 KH domain-containing protein [candidate division KSB3 bacterium]
MKSIEEQGKTIDDAINKALEQLQVNRDQISVEILEEGSRGLFGFMGTKPAKVRVSVTQGATYDALKEELQAVKEVSTSRPQSQQQSQTPPDTSSPPATQETQSQEESSPAPSDPLQHEKNVEHIVSEAKKALAIILERLQIEYTVEVKKREDQILLNIHCDNENFLIGRRGTTLDAVQYLVNRIANKQADEKIQVVLDTSNYRVNKKQRLQRLALRLSRRVKMTGKPVTVAPMNPHDRRIIHLTLQDDPAVRTLSRGSGFMRRIVISSSKQSDRNRKK